MNIQQAEELKKQAQQVERDMGTRTQDCPVCEDMVREGKCVYCDWSDKMTAEETCERFNNHWKKENVKQGYERPPKTPEDFKGLVNSALAHKKQAFENYLKEICFKINPSILDDDMPDFFNNWLGKLDGEDYMRCAELYGEEMYLKGKSDVLDNVITKEELMSEVI